MRCRIGGSLVALICAVALAQVSIAGAALAVDIAGEMRRLVETDWMEQDALFAASQSVATEPSSAAHTREIVRRGRQLAERLGASAAAFAALEAELATAPASGEPEAVRRERHFRAREALRALAFSNPLLDFDRILFIKRHHAKGVFHMCDQFYGFNAVPGGGLFVLEGAFTDTPKLRNLLADTKVEAGRLAGTRLDTGAFLSPELSFDGKAVLFAYTQAQGEDLEWSPQSSFHLFRVNADGTGLVQLTDGPWNDFDPCFLPDGRVAFISERRGGYLRCGRHCPVYTLHAMDADGGNLSKLSYHETHEWQPSVNHDGMLVYTRWDYVDRDTNIAHHIWTCFPDGRDPRSFHGNYPEQRESRPWMEMDIRAIPGSHKYVATAGAHHGHAFGSLVLIDPRLEDDGAMGQLTRLTPDVPFPESEKHLRPIEECMVYGTPWPLSEDDYLCAYAADSKNHGLYWIDRFGNRELLYRDAAIPSMSPIPVRPRPTPPVIPGLPDALPGEKATVTVINVYDSDFAWPEGTRIEALRVIQVLPKTTAPPNEPRIGVANQTNARAVLGTVPVEADGSAYFEVPPGKAIYFQALDAQGMAVQSMRSATYLQPGEALTCAGCHESKMRPPLPITETPLALKRAPSRLRPEPDGSNPFNFVRLVQPVLDRNCVGCHLEAEKAPDLRGVVEGKYGWTRAYASLAAEFGFYFDVSNGSINRGVHGGSRTTAGAFGAKAAPLMRMLDAGHHDVVLSEADRHRLVLWLDCNSEFYGSYEDTVAQALGEIVYPTLD